MAERRASRSKRVPNPAIPPKTASEVIGMYRTRLNMGDEMALRSEIYDMRALTDMTHHLPVPPQYQAIAQVVRTPFTRDSWLRIVAALTQNPPVGHVEGRDETKQARQAAEIAARWTDAALKGMQQPPGDNVIYGNVKSLVRDSEGVIKVVHRADAWANFPTREDDVEAETYNRRTMAYKKSQPLPFAWRNVDRLQMLFGDGEFGDDWAIEYGEYAKPYLASQYGMVYDGKGNLADPKYLLGSAPEPEGMLISATGKTIKYEYWDAAWWCVVIDGVMAPGFPKPNPYAPHLPYFRAKVTEPTLKALKFLQPMLDAVLTMKGNWAYLSAYPNPVIETLPNNLAPGLDLPIGDSSEPSELRWVPGKAFELPSGKTLKFLAPPPTGQDLNDMVKLLRDFVDVAGVPSVFRGIGGSDQAGYAINQLIAAANLTYKILATECQDQLTDIAKFLWFLVDKVIGQDVYVKTEIAEDQPMKWLCLKPSGTVTQTEAPVDMLATIEYQFRPVLPTDEQARAMIATQLMNAPKQVISHRYALEHYLQVDDPDGMMDDIAVEKILDTDPTLQQQMVQHALQRAGLGPAPQTSGLLGPNGQPLPPSQPGYPPGQAAAGMPAVPGLNQPLQPPQPGTPPITAGRPPSAGGMGGRPAGAYPGNPHSPVAATP